MSLLKFIVTGGGGQAMPVPEAKTIPSEAEEVARAVLFLASDDSSNVHGTEIVVDGGATGAPHGAPAYRAA